MKQNVRPSAVCDMRWYHDRARQSTASALPNLVRELNKIMNSRKILVEIFYFARDFYKVILNLTIASTAHTTRLENMIIFSIFIQCQSLRRLSRYSKINILNLRREKNFETKFLFFHRINQHRPTRWRQFLESWEIYSIYFHSLADSSLTPISVSDNSAPFHSDNLSCQCDVNCSVRRRPSESNV